MSCFCQHPRAPFWLRPQRSQLLLFWVHPPGSKAPAKLDPSPESSSLRSLWAAEGAAPSSGGAASPRLRIPVTPIFALGSLVLREVIASVVNSLCVFSMFPFAFSALTPVNLILYIFSVEITSVVSLLLTRPWLTQPPKGCQTDWIALSPYTVALLCSTLLFWLPLLQELSSTPRLASWYLFFLDAPSCSWTSPCQPPLWSPAAPYPGFLGSLVSSCSPWAIPSQFLPLTEDSSSPALPILPVGSYPTCIFLPEHPLALQYQYFPS